MPLKHKSHTTEEFAAVIPALKFGKLENFPNSENGRKVVITTPDDFAVDLQLATLEEPLDCPFGITQFTDEQTGKVRWTCTFTPKEGSAQAAALAALEERVVKAGQDNPDWFNKAGWPKKLVNDNGISLNFNSVLKESSNDEYRDPQWKTTVTPSNVRVFVKNEETGKFRTQPTNSYKLIERKRCKAVPMVSLAYVWFAGGKWGVKFYLNKIVVPHVDKGHDAASLADMKGMDGLEVEVEEEAAPAAQPQAPELPPLVEYAPVEAEAKRRKIQPAEDLDAILLGV